MEHTAELGLVAVVLVDLLASLNGLLLIICMAPAILCKSYGTKILCSVVHVVQIRLQQIYIAPIWCLCQRDMKRLFLLRASISHWYGSRLISDRGNQQRVVSPV